jgi:dethiobiotin synthetase
MSAHGVFIAGTDTGVGKTRVTAALLQALAARGLRAAGMKPVAAGTVAADTAAAPPGAAPDAAPVNEDVALIRAAAAIDGPAADINPYCFEWPISPHLCARRTGTSIEPAVIAAAYARLAGRCEMVVVEGTGGWLCPISEQRTMADVAVTLALPVVLVVGVRLGCLNHALLSARAVSGTGLPLAGWIGSVIEPQMQALEDNLAALAQWLPAPRLALLPFSAERGADVAHLATAAAALHAG